MRLRYLATALLAAATLSAPVAANAVTVGSPVIDRSVNDGFANFGFAFTDDVFGDGEVTSWSAFGTAGTIGLLVLDEVAPNQYEIAAIELQTIVDGLNTFATSISVTAGQLLGLYQGSGRVDFDFVSGTASQVYSANGALGLRPSVGTFFTGAGITPREYSISANVAPVPVPAGLPLMMAGLGALVLVRKRKTAA